MSISNYLENKVITGELITIPSYISLHTADPGETGANEVTGGSYVRKASTLGAPTNGVSVNASELLWTVMPACTVTHMCLWDAASNGNCLWIGPATASKTYGAGDECKIAAGTFSVTLD